MSNNEVPTTSGTMGAWLDAVRPASHRPEVMIAIYAACAPPIMKALGIGPRHLGVHLYGPTSCGKTTALRFAASVWGSPSDVEDVTENAALAHSGEAHNSARPLIVDDLRDFRDVYDLQRSYPVLLTASERAFESEGVAARILQVQCEMSHAVDASALDDNFGHLGAEVVKAVAGLPEDAKRAVRLAWEKRATADLDLKRLHANWRAEGVATLRMAATLIEEVVPGFPSGPDLRRFTMSTEDIVESHMLQVEDSVTKGELNKAILEMFASREFADALIAKARDYPMTLSGYEGRVVAAVKRMMGGMSVREVEKYFDAVRRAIEKHDAAK